MEANEGRPVVGDRRNMLGVRTSGEVVDVTPDRDGNVEAGQGMSVSNDWRKLPPMLIPMTYRRVVPAARGSASGVVFSFEDQSFESGHLTSRLFLRWDKGSHGLIEPETMMPIAEFQAALAATQDRWHVVQA